MGIAAVYPTIVLFHILSGILRQQFLSKIFQEMRSRVHCETMFSSSLTLETYGYYDLLLVEAVSIIIMMLIAD